MSERNSCATRVPHISPVCPRVTCMEKDCYDTHHYTIPPATDRRDILPLPHRCIGARVHWIPVDDSNMMDRCSKRPTKIIAGFSDTLVFLYPSYSAHSATTTQWIGPIYVMSRRRCRVLSANIELLSKSTFWTLATPKLCSVFICSAFAFLHLGILLAVSGECV